MQDTPVGRRGQMVAVDTIECTIPDAADGLMEAGVDLEAYGDAAIQMPAAWTAADLTFQGAVTLAGTYADVYDSDGNELTVSAAQARAIGLTAAEASVLRAFRFVKMRSGTSAVPVQQAADRTVTLILKR